MEEERWNDLLAYGVGMALIRRIRRRDGCALLLLQEDLW